MTALLRHRIQRQHVTTLREALSDDALLGQALPGNSWLPWRVLLIASMGEALTDNERAIFTQLTGRNREPEQRVEEFVGVIGRRGGKSRAISVLATFIAGLCQHPSLAAGETGVVLCIAPDTKQAGIILDYAEANFRNSPILRQLIKQRTADTLQLRNGINIEVRASDFRRLRGPTYIAVIADKSAFWFTSEYSSNPDAEILNSVRPGLATTGGPLFMISSPYARRGSLWQTFNRHFGPNGDPLILVAQAASRVMNSTLKQSVVDRAYERDPASAAAEFGAQFRTDVEDFVSLEAVRACVAAGVYERAPEHAVSYQGFVDPSGGGSDSFSLAIAHNITHKSCIVIDCLREVTPPFSPEAVVSDFTSVLKSYRIAKVTGDRFAGAWPVEQFSKYGIVFEQSAKPKSDLYRDLLPLLNSGRIELLDHSKTITQLVGLERRVARGGRDSIDHPPGGHDDLANAIAGAASIAVSKYGAYDTSFSGFQPDFQDRDNPNGVSDRDERDAWRASRNAAYLLSGGRIQ